MKLAAALLLASVTWLAAEVKVRVGDITNTRASENFFKGLEIDVNFSGVEFADAKLMRVNTTSVTDSTGGVVKAKFHLGNSGFQPLQRPFQRSVNEGHESYKLRLNFENPARAAEKISILGTLELLVPSKDPESVITISLSPSAGKPIDHPSLKAAGVEITLSVTDNNTVVGQVKDPKQMLGIVEFYTADGTSLGAGEQGKGGKREAYRLSYLFGKTLPADAVVKIYLATEKSIVAVPLKLENIELP